VLICLRGRPTLRTPDGERELEPGDVAFFPAGPDGAHAVYTRSNQPARYVIAARHVSPEVIEYPDSAKLVAMSRTGPPWSMHRRDETADYLDGESA
jgi:uncharacterized cupin superfamily protein